MKLIDKFLNNKLGIASDITKKQIDKLEYEKGRHGYQTNYIGQEVDSLKQRISKLPKEKRTLDFVSKILKDK